MAFHLSNLFKNRFGQAIATEDTAANPAAINPGQPLAVDGADLANWQKAGVSDADADGDVDGQDFLAWQKSRIQAGHADADGDVDGQDFLAWQKSQLHGLGDADGDSDVDGRDFLIWQASRGKAGLSDADQDGDVDGGDFLIWQKGHGKHASLDEPAADAPGSSGGDDNITAESLVPGRIEFPNARRGDGWYNLPEHDDDTLNVQSEHQAGLGVNPVTVPKLDGTSKEAGIMMDDDLLLRNTAAGGNVAGFNSASGMDLEKDTLARAVGQPGVLYNGHAGLGSNVNPVPGDQSGAISIDVWEHAAKGHRTKWEGPDFDAANAAPAPQSLIDREGSVPDFGVRGTGEVAIETLELQGGGGGSAGFISREGGFRGVTDGPAPLGFDRGYLPPPAATDPGLAPGAMGGAVEAHDRYANIEVSYLKGPGSEPEGILPFIEQSNFSSKTLPFHDGIHAGRHGAADPSPLDDDGSSTLLNLQPTAAANASGEMVPHVIDIPHQVDGANHDDAGAMTGDDGHGHASLADQLRDLEIHL